MGNDNAGPSDYEQYINTGKLLRADDVAKILDVTPSQVYKMAKSGDLRAAHIGKSVRFRQTDVVEFIGEAIEKGRKSTT